MSEYVRLVRQNRDFAYLWLAQVISLLGDWFNTIVLAALIPKLSESTGLLDEGLAVSLFLLARLVPPLLVSPIAGVLVDRFDRKRLLIISDLGRAGAVLLLVFATSDARWLWLIYLLIIFQFCLTAVFEPGRSAIMPSLLAPKDLVAANTLSSATWSAMLAIGAIVGGIVAAIFGTTTALLIDSSTFIISAVLIFQIKRHVNNAALVVESPIDSAKPDTSFADGLRYLRRRPSTILTLLVKTAQSLGNIDAIIIVYASEIFVMGNDSTIPLSIMYAAYGLGAVLGPLALNRFTNGTTRRLYWLIMIGFAWVTFGWFVFSGAGTLLLVCIALLLRAMGGSANWTYSSVIIQKTVPDHYLGRMFSIDMAGFRLASAIGILLTGILVDRVGPSNVRVVVMVLGAISILPLILWGASLPWLNRQPELVAPVSGD